jgi:hypothetical protein
MNDRHEFYTNLVVYLLMKVIRGGKKIIGKLVFNGLCGVKIPEICPKKNMWYQILYDGVQIRERGGRREPIKTLPYHYPLYLSLKFGRASTSQEYSY